MTVLQNDQTAWIQVILNRSAEGADTGKTVLAAKEGKRGLKQCGSRLKQRIIVSHIGGIADNDIKAPARKGSKPVAFLKVYCQTQARCIVARLQKGIWVEICCGDSGKRALGRKRQRDGATARTEVSNLDGCATGDRLECSLYQQFSFRSGHQRRCIQFEFQ